MPGLLVLNGGDEFNPGNEPQDRRLVAAARPGPAFVLPTAAARQRPEAAVAHAKRWFASLGLEVEELPVLKRSDANSEQLAQRAAGGGFFYLVGGDPGHVAKVLRESRVWAAIEAAWQSGAALAGSSAGAMALCAVTLVIARWPRHDDRRGIPALNVVPGTALLPHYNTFGHRWIDSARGDLSAAGLLLFGVDERSAAIWDGGGWSAAGAGAVTVVGSEGPASFPPGSAVTGLPDPAQAPG